MPVQSDGLLSGNDFVTEFLEVRVECESRTDARPPHDFETRAVDKTQGAAARRQVSPDSGFVDFPRHPE